MFLLLFLLDDGRIRIRIREVQKPMDPNGSGSATLEPTCRAERWATCAAGWRGSGCGSCWAACSTPASWGGPRARPSSWPSGPPPPGATTSQRTSGATVFISSGSDPDPAWIWLPDAYSFHHQWFGSGSSMDLAFLVPDPDQLAVKKFKKNLTFYQLQLFFFEVVFLVTAPTQQCLNTHHIPSLKNILLFLFLS